MRFVCARLHLCGLCAELTNEFCYLLSSDSSQFLPSSWPRAPFSYGLALFVQDLAFRTPSQATQTLEKKWFLHKKYRCRRNDSTGNKQLSKDLCDQRDLWRVTEVRRQKVQDLTSRIPVIFQSQKWITEEKFCHFGNGTYVCTRQIFEAR